MFLCLTPCHPVTLIIGLVIWVAVYFSLGHSNLHVPVYGWHAPPVHNQSVFQEREALQGMDCECYVTTGPNPGYFRHFDFYDFRKQAVPKSRDIRVMPPSVTLSDSPFGVDTGKGSVFQDNSFRKHWHYDPFIHSPSTSTPLTMANSMQNVFVYRDEKVASNPVLLLRTTRNAHFQSVGEISAMDQKIVAVTARSRARILHSSKPGASAGLTIFNHAAGEEFSLNSRTFFGDGLMIGDSASGAFPDSHYEWGVRRLDYLYPYSSAWSNDKVEYVQRDWMDVGERQVSLSAWSDGTHPTKVGDEAYIAVEWIMMAYNNSGDYSRNERSCEKACKIDDLRVIGVPERVDINHLKVEAFPEYMIMDRDDSGWYQNMSTGIKRMDRQAPNALPETKVRETSKTGMFMQGKSNRKTRRILDKGVQSAMTPPDNQGNENQNETPSGEAPKGETPEVDAPDVGAPEDEAPESEIPDGSPSSGDDPLSGDPTSGDPSAPTEEVEPIIDTPFKCKFAGKIVSIHPCCACLHLCFANTNASTNPKQLYQHQSRLTGRSARGQQKTSRNSTLNKTACESCESRADAEKICLDSLNRDPSGGSAGDKQSGVNVKSIVVFGGAALVVVSILVVLGCS